MKNLDTPEQGASDQEPGEPDPLARFRNWPGFLAAAIALNALFVYGMFAGASDPEVRGWFKALSWLPFNVIASALYFVLMVKLSKTGGHGALYAVICLAMIAANWIAFFAA
ncbi:MAG: hypothetical protein KBF24_09895 [Thiobacillaceae bacterium]|nr:hypothetical protein [Thiobacillaceae bacterium]